MTVAISKTIVADDHTEVDTKLDQLMRENEITSDEILQFGIVPFGAQKFLITLLYWGTYLQRAFLNLASSTVKYGVGSTKKPLLGLLSKRGFGLKRAIKTSLGLLSVVFSRGFGTAIETGNGLLSIVGDIEGWGRDLVSAQGFLSIVNMGKGVIVSAAEGFVASTIAYIHVYGEHPNLGFAVDMSWIWTHP